MRLLIFAALALFAVAGDANAFDCSHSSVPAQAVICSDPELLKLVDQRDAALAAARERSKGSQRSALLAQQRKWLRDYPHSCGVAEHGRLASPISPDIDACFKRAIEERITTLQAYPPAKAASDATTPVPAPNPNAVKTAASPPADAPAKPNAVKAAAVAPIVAAQPASVAVSTGQTYKLKFTFACRTPAKLQEVLKALAQNDFGFPLAQDDCLPVPEGRTATLLSLDGNVAHVRLCSSEAGCTEVYADAAALLTNDGAPALK